MPVQSGAVPVRSYMDGPRITIDTFLKDPLRIQELIFQMADQQFLADALLRSAGPVTGGAVQFSQSTPFYADSDSLKRPEFAEVPVGTTSRGTPQVVYVNERALAILISDEMQRRMNVDPVNVQLMQIRNTMVQNWDKAFIDAVLAAITQNVDNSNDWADASPTAANAIRIDINAARKVIALAKAPGQNTAYGFKADTLVISEARSFDLLTQEDFNKPYLGNIADENLLYTGKLPSKILGLDVVTSRVLDDDIALVLQRKVFGFIADELPLQTSALYRDEPRKTWRADVQRASAIGIDQPLAVASINIGA